MAAGSRKEYLLLITPIPYSYLLSLIRLSVNKKHVYQQYQLVSLKLPLPQPTTELLTTNEKRRVKLSF